MAVSLVINFGLLSRQFRPILAQDRFSFCRDSAAYNEFFLQKRPMLYGHVINNVVNCCHFWLTLFSFVIKLKLFL